jgi:DNA-binding NarL/FixJ family response regulator
MTKILVIEDEEPLLQEILDTLQFEGFDVEGASNGLEGLQLAFKHMPDLIVCDVMMPGLDGYGVLLGLRENSEMAIIPFVFLTAKTDKTDVRRGMDLGADDYLTKPFASADLLAAIRVRLAKKAAAETHRLRIYAHKLVALQEHERRNTADALQNKLGQIVTGLQVTLEMSKHLPPAGLRAALEEAEAMAGQVSIAINETSLSLWPAPLDHLGLLPALFWQFERYTARTGVQVDFQHKGLNHSFVAPLKAAVFRIIQEALENVDKHAGVDRVQVRAWVEEQRINIQIEDEGVGFALDENLTSVDAIGLIGMHERTVALGGSMAIMSAPHEGTMVSVQIPLADKERPEQNQDEQNSPTITVSAPVKPPASLMHQSLLENENEPVTIAPPRPRRMGREISIVLADDNDITRRGLRSLLEAQSGFSVIGEVVCGTDVADMVHQLGPDVLVLNLVMPELGGLEITSQVALQCPETRVLILSPYHEEAYFLEAFRRGATGYILKNTSVDNLAQAVREVVANRRYLSPSLSDRAIESYIDIQRIQKDPTQDPYGTLTNREREVLHLVLDGHTNAAIAEQLVISPRTAETHRANMMRKIGVRNYRELLRFALRRGIITVED